MMHYSLRNLLFIIISGFLLIMWGLYFIAFQIIRPLSYLDTAAALFAKPNVDINGLMQFSRMVRETRWRTFCGNETIIFRG